MYAEYTNVGECHGENVTMRIWLEDWQNTVVPSGYEDVDAVVVAIDHNKPVIDIKGLLWIKVRFAYYDSKGNPLNVKGYFYTFQIWTLSRAFIWLMRQNISI